MLLAIDTSTAQVGLALYDGNQILAETTWTSPRRHTTEVAPALAETLARADLQAGDVGALGVAIGPGSFTALRVGLALAKGLALARRIPLFGIPTLDIIAAAQPPAEHPLLVAIQAGRRRFALGAYENAGERWQPKGQIRGATLDELAESIEVPTLLAGEFSAEERKRLSRVKNVLLVPPIRCVRRPSILADLAWARFEKNEADEPAALAPIYLHIEGTPIS